MQYVTFWIPLNNHINFDEAFKAIDIDTLSNDISDEVVQTQRLLKGKVLDNRTIEFEINELVEEVEQKKTFTINFVKSSEVGFLTYSFNFDDKDFIDVLTVQAYHLVKSFFHAHECHHEEQDALLGEAYVTTTEPNSYHDAAVYYAENYEVKFENYKMLIEQKASAEKILETYKKKKMFRVPDVIAAIAKVQRKIHKIKMELNYFLFLINTMDNDKPYNGKGCTAKVYFLQEHKNQLLSYDVLYQDYEILDDQIDISLSTMINGYQMFLAIAGIILGTWGIYIGLNGLSEENFLKDHRPVAEQVSNIDKTTTEIKRNQHYDIAIGTNTLNQMSEANNTHHK